MSTAFRIVLVIAAVAIAIALLLGPAWRGGFYRSWLRPRLVAMGLIIVVLTAGEYLFRVFTAIKSR
jgi:hypothetical protein